MKLNLSHYQKTILFAYVDLRQGSISDAINLAFKLLEQETKQYLVKDKNNEEAKT